MGELRQRWDRTTVVLLCENRHFILTATIYSQSSRVPVSHCYTIYIIFTLFLFLPVYATVGEVLRRAGIYAPSSSYFFS